MTARKKLDVGTKIDAAYKLREKRLKLERQVQALKHDENKLRTEVIGELAKSKLTSAAGRLATFSYNPNHIIPVVTDWNAVYDYIGENEAYDLMQRRINEKAWRDRLDNDDPVTGIKTERVVKVSLTKKKR